MNKEQAEMLKEAHDAAKRVEHYLFRQPGPNRPSRAEALDNIIFGLKAGKFGYRILIGTAAMLAAVGAAYSYLKGWKL